jgi:hypothetical protein
VAGEPQPAARVLLPERPGAMATMDIAGVVPAPEYDRVTETWLLLTMLNPVADTPSTVLIARKLDVVLWYPGPNGPR